MADSHGDLPADWADHHVARWRDHWIDIDFDDEVEAITVRLERIRRHLKRTTRQAVEAVGLQPHEYETLHHLVIRDTPGRATPSVLAADLGVSGAGMTGRLDALEKAGRIRRTPSADDRRRVEIEIIDSGLDLWRRAMTLRGRAEDELFAVLSDRGRSRFAALLKELTLHIEGRE